MMLIARRSLTDDGRVEELGLHVQPHVLRRDPVEADAGGVADGVDDAVVKASATFGRA